MDFSKFKTSDWLMIGGGVCDVDLRLPRWVTCQTPASVRLGRQRSFDYFLTGTIPWILVIAARRGDGAARAGKLNTEQPWPLILLAATGLAALLLLIRLIFNPIEADLIESPAATSGVASA